MGWLLPMHLREQQPLSWRDYRRRRGAPCGYFQSQLTSTAITLDANEIFRMDHSPQRPDGSVSEFRVFLKFDLTSFGGPIAHLGISATN